MTFQTAQMILAGYGVFLFLGAFMGLKAGSRVSLIMGIVVSLIVGVGVYLTESDPIQGFQILTGVSGLLALVFAIRLLKTRKFMPAGMLLIVSLAACGICLTQI